MQHAVVVDEDRVAALEAQRHLQRLERRLEHARVRIKVEHVLKPERAQRRAVRVVVAEADDLGRDRMQLKDRRGVHQMPLALDVVEGDGYAAKVRKGRREVTPKHFGRHEPIGQLGAAAVRFTGGWRRLLDAVEELDARLRLEVAAVSVQRQLYVGVRRVDHVLQIAWGRVPNIAIHGRLHHAELRRERLRRLDRGWHATHAQDAGTPQVPQRRQRGFVGHGARRHQRLPGHIGHVSARHLFRQPGDHLVGPRRHNLDARCRSGTDPNVVAVLKEPLGGKGRDVFLAARLVGCRPRDLDMIAVDVHARGRGARDVP